MHACMQALVRGNTGFRSHVALDANLLKSSSSSLSGGGGGGGAAGDAPSVNEAVASMLTYQHIAHTAAWYLLAWDALTH